MRSDGESGPRCVVFSGEMGVMCGLCSRPHAAVRHGQTKHETHTSLSTQRQWEQCAPILQRGAHTPLLCSRYPHGQCRARIQRADTTPRRLTVGRTGGPQSLANGAQGAEFPARRKSCASYLPRPSCNSMTTEKSYAFFSTRFPKAAHTRARKHIACARSHTQEELTKGVFGVS